MKLTAQHLPATKSYIKDLVKNHQYDQLNTLLEEIILDNVNLPKEQPEHIEITAQFDLNHDSVEEIRTYIDTQIKKGKTINIYVFNQ